MKCTWKNCNEQGCHSQIALDGHVWANLCPKHDAEVHRERRAISEASTINPARLMYVWVMAQGGAKPAATRFA